MDVIAYSYADEQKKKIDKFISDPKSDDGIVTVPKVVRTGEAVTIPTNRQVVMRSLTVENGASVTLEGDGEIFVPTGGAGLSSPVMTTDSIETSTTLKTVLTDDLVKQTNGIIEDIDGVALYADRGLKNRFMNGGFTVTQRGSSFSALASIHYTLDRWEIHAGTSGSITVSQEAFTLGQTDVEGFPRYYLRYNGTLGTTWSGRVSQKIEDVTKLSGKTVTLSFWAKAGTLTDNVQVGMYQSFGDGGSTGISTTIADPVSIGTTWSKYVYTFTVPSIAGKTVGAGSFLSIHPILLPTAVFASTAVDISIAQVQIEEGTVATSFEERPFQLELSLCQRYYEARGYGRIQGYATTTQHLLVEIPYAVPKRTSPTVVVINTATLNSTAGLTAFTTASTSASFTGRVIPLVNGMAGGTYNWTSDAEL